MKDEEVFTELVSRSKLGVSELWHSDDLAVIWAHDRIQHLERINKEWEQLWKPIDDLVRPITPLGGCVGDKTVSLIEASNYFDPIREMSKAHCEWMARKKLSLVDKITLQGVAKIAHTGDMVDALTRIREITLPYWDKVLHND